METSKLTILNKCLIDFNLPPYNECVIKTVQNIFSKLKKHSEDRTLIGECFSETQWTTRGVINLINVSHLIANLRLEDNKFIGDIEILDTPKGRIVKEIYYQTESSVIFLPRCESFGRHKLVEEIFTFDIFLVNKAQKVE